MKLLYMTQCNVIGFISFLEKNPLSLTILDGKKKKRKKRKEKKRKKAPILISQENAFISFLE